MRDAGTGEPSIVIGFDTEYVELEDHAGRYRVIVSYQFAAVNPSDPSTMVLVVLLPMSVFRLRLYSALRIVWEEAGLWRHELVAADEAVGERGVHRSDFWDGRDTKRARKSPEQRRWDRLFKHSIPITLACHFGKADMTTFRITGEDPDHMTSLTSAAGGLVTLQPFRVRGTTDGHRDRWWLPFSVSIADTMAHAPAGKKSLDVLGESCGVPKIELPDGAIERMDRYRRDRLEHFLEYSANDPAVVVEYLARLWGADTRPPVTLSSGAAKAFRGAIVDHWFGKAVKGRPIVDVGRWTRERFSENFAGLRKVESGTEATEDGRSFYTERNLEPVDGDARTVLDYTAVAYHGGYNACAEPGYHRGTTYDFDLQGAYPTSMCLVPDIDWLHPGGVIEETIETRELTLDDVPEPMSPFVGDVEFEFGEDCLFPTLPIFEDGAPMYVRTSRGRSGTMAMGPEIHLALKLGARVICRRGYKLRVLRLPDGETSYALRAGVTAMVQDRARTKKLFGKGSLEEQAVKTMCNSTYGKTAQDVAGQNGWDAHNQEMAPVGGSAITSPYHAAMTTSFVRAELLAAANQLTALGYKFYSVTTDGFITDADLDVVVCLDLHGFAEVAGDSRARLADGDRSIWEIKHAQTELINLTTRGNVGRGHATLPGVLAKNSYKTPREILADGREREGFWDLVIIRTARVDNPVLRFPSFKELSCSGTNRSKRKDFVTLGGRPEDWQDSDWIEWDTDEVFETVVAGGRKLSMDFDCKRRPVMESMRAERAPASEGELYEVATFTTRPWDTIDDCLRGRKVAKNAADASGCLRRVSDWSGWALRFEHGEGRRIADPHRAVLLSILVGHRHGLIGYDIPGLADSAGTVVQRLAWLSGWGLGVVTPSDWKNARRPERAGQVLASAACEPFLSAIRGCPAGHPPHDLTTSWNDVYEEEIA
ncbi:hypothetical protein [Gordonia hydrophobica]|uniref:DNA-directed DNA polymerase n=1 Tax=Gordonia hydrophobica TaxID=40516 RepID=A0ABZ2TXN5_9ACTN|nr:hypothetical protein [Gordonia hydrophobica]MBM7366346.1 hypothetical protein [Gordonia hydrophobica]